MIAWKRNLVMVGLSQFLSMMGFAFAMPFTPYYIQQLGITEPNELKMWVALFTAAAPLTMAVASPIWGTLSDRYGRRLMLLRANFGGMLVLILMGLAPNVQTLVILRLAQGVLTGTMNAAQTFVSVQSPSHRSGMVLGTLSAAVFSGCMCGAFIGGLFAEWFGYRMAFLASGVFLLLAGLLVLLGTREEFVRPMEEEADSMEDRVRMFWGKIGPAIPILALMAAMGFALHFDLAWLPLLVQEIHGSLKGAAFWTGSLAAVGGIAGFLAGPIIGRIADRIAPPRIGKISAFGAGLMMIVVGLSHGFAQLFMGRFGATFCAGGLDPVFQIWLAKTTPAASRGFIFGWAVTARSLGWMMAPLASGVVAWMFGLRAVFFVAAAFFFLLIPLIALIVRYLPPAPQPSAKKA
ncbi:MAG: MFS transporter [Verrucomicrobia bacterium]|nr:MFS transporter [Verrucomicrobiota bacterium]MBU4286293.1 MFS transporter [Verrucomicrobiota bacterium]